MSGRIERVVVPLDAAAENRTAIDTAARVAARAKALLHGVFVEDEELLSAAGLGFTRQSTLGAGAEPFTMERTALQLEAAAERARRDLAAIAEHRQLKWSFEIVRGPSQRAFVSATERDLLVAGGLTRPVSGSGRPPSRSRVSREQPRAHSAIAVGESCPAAVNAHTARASTYPSGCHRPALLRGSGTICSHSRRQQRDGAPPQRAAPMSRAGTVIREDRDSGTVLSGGWLRFEPPILRKPCPPAKSRARTPQTAHPICGHMPPTRKIANLPGPCTQDGFEFLWIGQRLNRHAVNEGDPRVTKQVIPGDVHRAPGVVVRPVDLQDASPALVSHEDIRFPRVTRNPAPGKREDSYRLVARKALLEPPERPVDAQLALVREG